jgi:hypothetical protein
VTERGSDRALPRPARDLIDAADLLRDLADAAELRAEGNPAAFGDEQVLAVHRMAGQIDALLDQLATIEEATRKVVPLFRRTLTPVSDPDPERTPS